ncbi:hypothetical protein RYZ26_07925 [Terasakiella sp. A23]|uniref:hypothetical protein n=1 Tax=Terasakiella sp. FCG-A23 TaxID=3080561 RepID=UPI0029534708|nr:hypothetical protein [Terasakiella sp. A23]MDV7339515.1 hypothetical protein [Terasakiella sp. A23]
MLRPGITRERLAGLCLLGILLFSPGLIAIFDRGADATLLGVPVLLLYLFGVWVALIFIAAVLVVRRQMDAPEPVDLEED